MNKKSRKLAKEQAAYLDLEKQFGKRSRTRAKKLEAQVANVRLKLAAFNTGCPGVLYQSRNGGWRLFKPMQVPRFSSKVGR